MPWAGSDPGRCDEPTCAARTHARPGHRRHRVHRGPLGPGTPRGRPARSGHGPAAPVSGRPRVVRPGGDRRGRRSRPCQPHRMPARRGRRLLPHPLPGHRHPLRGPRPHERPELRCRGTKLRGRPDRLSRWPVPGGAGVEPASGIAQGGRGNLPGQRSSHHRAARRRHSRFRVRVVRDVALPHRTAAGHGHSPVGRHPDPAHRGHRRPALPRRLGHHARRRQPRLRHRRPRGLDVPADDGRLRQDRRAETASHRRRFRC